MDAPTMMEGYALCPCGTWVVDAVAARTKGRCHECYLVHVRPHLNQLEVVGDGMRVKVPTGSAKNRRKRKRRETEARQSKRAQARAARDAARQRLSVMVPDLYDVVLADERAKRGLDPYPLEIALRGRDPHADLAYIERIRTEMSRR